jgi:mRNA-degrading endonuclease toxin of MazEF toxin-antitoxin module
LTDYIPNSGDLVYINWPDQGQSTRRLMAMAMSNRDFNKTGGALFLPVASKAAGYGPQIALDLAEYGIEGASGVLMTFPVRHLDYTHREVEFFQKAPS